jgi:hypothetical protein
MSLEQKIIECKEVAKSFEYFLDNYCFIEDKENNIAVRFKLWPEQRRILPEFLNSKLLMILKARQLGLTWITACFVLWLALTKPLFLALIISVNEDLSIEFLDRIVFVLDRLPIWLKVAVKSKTKQAIEFQHQNGLISTIKSMPSTEMGGQSKTPSLLILDETCKNRLIKSIFNATFPGVEAAKGQVIVISNAIKEGAGWYWTRDMFIGSQHGTNKFKRIFLSWTANPNRPETFLQDMLMSGMSQRDIDENYCATEDDAIADRNIKGVYYGRQLAEAQSQGRICSVPYAEGHEVYTFWDLGVDDSTTIWFMQQIGLQYRFIDYYENTGMSFVHYAKILKEKNYIYGEHYMPHDAQQRHLGGGDSEIALSKKDIAENLGIYPIELVAKPKDSQAVLNSIENGRNIFGQCVFDKTKCHNGIMCLMNYRAKYDEEKDKLSNKPEDNWAIHGADGFRTFVEGYKPKRFIAKPKSNYSNKSSGSHGYLGG